MFYFYPKYDLPSQQQVVQANAAHFQFGKSPKENRLIVEELTAQVLPVAHLDLMNDEGNSMEVAIDRDKGVV